MSEMMHITNLLGPCFTCDDDDRCVTHKYLEHWPILPCPVVDLRVRVKWDIQLQGVHMVSQRKAPELVPSREMPRSCIV